MSNIVKINDTDLQVIEYRGQRVATLAQIDTVHKRPEGTARRTYNTNKQHLVEGEDYCKVSADEFRTRFPAIISDRATEDMTLVFESGYLMLVKSFTDDLAWQVQRQLVNGYFRAKESATLPQPEKAKPARARGRTPLEQVKIINFVGDALKHVPGVRLEIVAAAKLKAFQQHTGIDFSDFRRALPPVALERMVHLNPKEIGIRIAEQTGQAKISSQAVNKVLIDLGLQRRAESGYVLTETGTKYGEAHDFRADNDHAGIQIDWWEAVVPLVRDNLPAEKPQRAKTAHKDALFLDHQKIAPEPQGALL
ncbi:ORF6N domain-containing protein [Simplicispira psychrophila]|uniref:ORF6N domain-containing protein n=1 Tax=Simplicispira psychrophila TaxID=80882 RepID=UPI00068DC4FE|nr:ORF6N domain-containing protein [Simplicispira psychrophila]